MSLRILVVDGHRKFSVGASYHRAFAALGHESHFIDNTGFLGGWNPSLLNRVARRITRPLTLPIYNGYLLQQARRLRPDVFFACKGNHLYPETLRLLRRFAGKTVVFQNDDVMSRITTTDAIRRGVPHWDLVLTPREFAVQELYEMGARRAEYVRFAYDPALHFPPMDDDRDATLSGAAVFVGTYREERVEALEALAKEVHVVIYGNSWEHIARGSSLRRSVRPPVFEDDARRVIASAGVNIAFCTKLNRDQHTMRTFEIPACGGFMLAERTPLHSELYREGEEAAFFESTDELVAQTQRYLADPALRARVAAAGKRRVTDRERYQERAAAIVDMLDGRPAS